MNFNILRYFWHVSINGRSQLSKNLLPGPLNPRNNIYICWQSIILPVTLLMVKKYTNFSNAVNKI